MNNTIFHAADTRGHANHGWLDSHHTFSFAGYHNPERVHFGVLRVLNDDIVAGGTGFGKHPHDNMEIISIVLDGALEHQDSMGHKQPITTGEVQVMSAGSGVVHSEYNHNRDKKVNFLQIWIFPNKRDVEPRYDQKRFEEADRINKLQTLVSPVGRKDGGLQIQQDAWIYRTRLEAGKEVTHKLHSNTNGVYAFVIEGGGEVAGNKVSRRDGIGITDMQEVTLRAEKDSDILLLEVPMQL